MKFRILLADDHALFRQALRMSLDTHPDMETVAEVQDGNGIMEAVAQTLPDIVCLDLTMPGPASTDITQQLLATYPALKIIAISAHGDLFRVAKIIDAGAHAYVTKMDIASQLPIAIQSVSKQKIYFSPDLGIDSLAQLAPYATVD